MAAFAISQSSSLAPNSSKAKDATASIFSMIDRKSEIDPSAEIGETLQNLKGEIQFRHVSFRYPSRPDVQILRDLSLTIPSGKVLSLFLFLFFFPSYLKLSMNKFFHFWFSDCCFGWRKWVWKIHCHFTIAEVL